MTTFIKTKFNISDDQTNIDKYRLSAKITVYLKINLATNHYYKLLWSRESFEESIISDWESPSNFQVKKRKKLLKSRNNEIVLYLKCQLI